MEIGREGHEGGHLGADRVPWNCQRGNDETVRMRVTGAHMDFKAERQKGARSSSLRKWGIGYTGTGFGGRGHEGRWNWIAGRWRSARKTYESGYSGSDKQSLTAYRDTDQAGTPPIL
uniref:Uncharacterized protein n=1 Tax=Chromera velia CCMP2878 TaxID=1169474 RepID=A0A0G4G1B6_9ALVE|eukprot:Cvel_19692.t1-p1 / transcript=Cvel_19692.t1 / gene=Cvel_19692 / organism=Chromera_velia_CCMP2878 / gene_product=hypothetical protein / transcript_product=hypothetical protein / location=Cvel_scaffold1718:7752-8584(-) / protein_length=116 / sequence_SO=supercontig / SO=protein_coding / is_pseudo=false